MNGLPYYKAYPRDFFGGTVGMSFELKAAYRMVIDLIYMHGGDLPDDSRYIAGHLGCSTRAWNGYRETLISSGKISAENGIISNFRADKELESLRSLQDKQRKNASQPRKNKDLGLAVAEPKQSHTESDTDTDKKERKRNAPDGARVVGLFTADETPARDERSEQFDRFWKAYPEKKAKPAARKAFAKQIKDGANPEEIITGAERYAARLHNVQPGQFMPHPKYPQGWLNERRWEDEPAPEAKAARRYFGEVVR